MKKMQETEFDKIVWKRNAKECPHSFVKLYDRGTHSDYGCELCGMKTMTPEQYCRESEED